MRDREGMTFNTTTRTRRLAPSHAFVVPVVRELPALSFRG